MMVEGPLTFYENKAFDVVVMGAGLMGSATAWHLSNQGKRVLLLEKQLQGYTQGSSKGSARICRSSNIEDNVLWSYLHERSVKETEGLIKYLNAEGVGIAMEDIYTTAPVSYLAPHDVINTLLSNLDRQDVPFELASTPEEGQSKFGVRMGEGIFLHREYKPYSGTLNPQKLIWALHRGIGLKGSIVAYGAEVTKIKKKDGNYRLTVKDAEQGVRQLRTDQLISAVGPYTPKLLQPLAPYLEFLIRPKRVFLAFFGLKNDIWSHLKTVLQNQLVNGFPIIDRSPREQIEEFFAMIEGYGSAGNPILKVGGHLQRTAVEDPDAIWGRKLSREEIAWSKEKLLDYLKILNVPIEAEHLELVDEYSCIYSLTDTEVPYVTPIHNKALRKDGDFIVIAGLSGVGAKGSMAYGRIAANLLLGITENDPAYQLAISQLGYERLLKDLSDKV